MSGGVEKLELCINGAQGLALVQILYSASACKSQASLLSSPGITLTAGAQPSLAYLRCILNLSCTRIHRVTAAYVSLTSIPIWDVAEVVFHPPCSEAKQKLKSTDVESNGKWDDILLVPPRAQSKVWFKVHKCKYRTLQQSTCAESKETKTKKKQAEAITWSPTATYKNVRQMCEGLKKCLQNRKLNHFP